jgi:Domain of unknown function (DUF3943)
MDRLIADVPSVAQASSTAPFACRPRWVRAIPPGAVLLLAGLLLVSPQQAAAGEQDTEPVPLQLAARTEPTAEAPADPIGAPSEAQQAPAADATELQPEADPMRWYHSGYPWRGAPPPAPPDWRGLRRDTGYFLAYQAVVIGVLFALPTSVTKWESSDIGDPFERWRENVSNPVWDKDEAFINYVLHPYWGGAYYVRGRERGLDRPQSFLYSAFLSTLYEYTYEAFFERVSLTDLIVTPVLGTLVGEYLFTPIREHIRAKSGELTWSDKALLVLTDPLGVVGAWTDRTWGVTAELSIRPPTTTLVGRRYNDAIGDRPSAFGSALTTKQSWGLQLRIPL